MTARLITEADLQLIRKYDKRSEEEQASLLAESGPGLAEALLNVLKNVSKEEPTQYVLALILQFLSADRSRARYFHHGYYQPTHQEPYTAFLRLLQRYDSWFTQEKACEIIQAIIEFRPNKASVQADGTAGAEEADQHILAYLDWLLSQIKRPTKADKSIPTAVSALAGLLKERKLRVLFLASNGVPLVAPLIKTANNPTSSQLLYEICLCMWEMSFLAEACAAMASAGVVKPLVEVCRQAQKEKVFRVALSTLRNLLECEKSEELGLASDMVEGGLQKVIATRMLQSWHDEDIPEQLTYMEDRLREGVQVLSSFDKYMKEVSSGYMEWSPMHTSEIFWRENITKFEDKEYALLRAIIKFLQTSREGKVLAVACNDLAQFINFHPQGRYLVREFGGKECVMRLMDHPEPDVQKQALMCVQKLMLSKEKLDFLQMVV